MVTNTTFRQNICTYWSCCLLCARTVVYFHPIPSSFANNTTESTHPLAFNGAQGKLEYIPSISILWYVTPAFFLISSACNLALSNTCTGEATEGREGRGGRELQRLVRLSGAAVILLLIIWYRAPQFNSSDYVRLPPHFLSFPMISGYYYVCRLKTPNLSSNMLRHLTSTMAALGTGSIVPIVHSTVRYYYPLVTGKAAHGRAHLLWDWVGTHTQATSQ